MVATKEEDSMVATLVVVCRLQWVRPKEAPSQGIGRETHLRGQEKRGEHEAISNKRKRKQDSREKEEARRCLR